MTVPADELTELKGQFLASLNHEIRTPLSGILGMADLLLETGLDDEQRDYVHAARECAEDLLGSLNSMLEYSAVSSGHVKLDHTEFPLTETIEGAIREFAGKASAKNVRLTCSFDASVPRTAVSDAVRLRQILRELVSNAVKFTSSGEIHVSAKARQQNGDARLSISVRDTGIGIRPEKLSTLFECFRQVETGLSRTHAGLGLGLAMVDSLVRLFGGEISVTSEPGKGTTFLVDLPFTVPIAAPATHEKDTAHNILIVDDNAVAQTVAKHVLQRNYFSVECASSGAEALEKASGKRYDLILLDLQMPGLDGFATLERLRTIEGYAQVPVLALTANCLDDYRELSSGLGMAGFLPKPVRSADLLEAVRSNLSGAARKLVASAPGERVQMVV